MHSASLRLFLALTLAAGALSAEAQLANLTPARRALNLNGRWSLTYGAVTLATMETAAPPAGWKTISAQVPGNVELDLMKAGKLPDPSVGNNILKLRQLEDHQWWYQRDFDAPAAASGEHVELVFDGLDCIATIWVNGQLAGHTANMLIPHRLDVTRLLRPGRNQLRVRLDPAVLVGRMHSAGPGEWAEEGHWESLSVRKAPHMYGWDILPRAVSAGIWRDVRLEYVHSTHWNWSYWATRQADAAHRSATVELDWEFATERTLPEQYRVHIALSRNGHTIYESDVSALSTRGRQTLQLENVDLWWPRGYGEAALYDASVTLNDREGHVVDELHTALGIRTIALSHTGMTRPEAPGDFGFIVNGERIFVKGTNWVPLDSLHSRDLQHVDAAVGMLNELNCNMVRCWGGNVYESDRFFDLCDRAGIMVWQDFALACALYPQNDSFYEVMREEATAVTSRLRNHPSLALWAGNNEIDDAYSWTGLGHLDPNHDRISREVLPGVVAQMDPYRAYLPSSPYHSPELFAAGNDARWMPEVHLWGPRGYYKTPYYTGSAAHFVSEIGYHGAPSRASLEQMFDASSVYPWTKDHEWNDEWLTKSVRFHPLATNTAGRNDLMLKQVRALFGAVPDKLDDFVLASQITQAEAMKFFVEFWRHDKGQRWGILWWNLRDGWPLISDAVVDYYDRPKLAYQYLLRVQRDVQAICDEAVAGRHPITVVNDTREPARGHLALRKAGSGAVLYESDFDIAANGKVDLGSIPHPDQAEMWLIEWSWNGRPAVTSHYLAAAAPISLEQYRQWLPLLKLQAEGAK